MTAETFGNNLNKRPSEIVKKTVAARSLKKAKKYFDSADWSLSLVRYQSNLASAVEVEQPQEELEEPVCVEDVVQRRVMPERKYFDSADWVLSGQVPLPSQTYNGFAQPQNDQIVAKKILAHRANKKFFDSADWALGNNIQCLMAPKLTVLKS